MGGTLLGTQDGEGHIRAGHRGVLFGKGCREGKLVKRVKGKGKVRKKKLLEREREY